MELYDLQKYFNKNFRLTFEYKSEYYSIWKTKRLFGVNYLLIDTDNPPQREKSLERLLLHGVVHDGAKLNEIKNHIEMIPWDSPLWESYEAIRHLIVLYNNEIHFMYKGIYYWIAHAPNGTSHLSDDFENTQTFDSSQDLFEHARIDKKSLKEIWPDVVVD